MSNRDKMRELYDPVYYPPNIQGFDDPYHQQRYQQLRRAQSSSKSGGGSSSSSTASSVLGRFLKLGKSKSDASLSGGNNNNNNGGGGIYGFSTGLFNTSSNGNHQSSASSVIGGGGGGGGGRSSSSRSNYGGANDELDEFRLPPSVIARGPVEKMVHKANSRKDVSRSHSWIYGSVKLPSDLPFGYGDQFSFHGEGGGMDVDEQQQQQHQIGGDHHHQNSQQSGSSSSGHYLHTHGLHSMQIPRCSLDYYCTCDCGGGGVSDGGGMMSPSGRHIAGGSVRAGGLRPTAPCQGCAREMAMGYALPSKSSRNKSGGGAGGDSESFVSSVRKLTWKSLKQVVKKRPSLDTLKRMPQQHQHQQVPVEYLSAPIVPLPYLSPSAVAAVSATNPQGGGGMMIPAPLSPTVNANPMANLSHYGGGHHNPRLSHHQSQNGAVPNHPPNGGAPLSPQADSQLLLQPNYFFPEKKGFYASCNDIYSPGGEPAPPNVTASVRVRPKRTRQPWQFENGNGSAQANEFGPVPNYEEDQREEEQDQAQLYHSEWDLRHVMSYDMWMNATSNVKPRPGAGPTQSGGSISSKSGRSQAHSISSGNLHVPPPDYAPSEPPTTFRPQKNNMTPQLQQSRSSPNLHKLAAGTGNSSSSKSGQNNGSVKMGKSASSSHRSLASLHSPSGGSTISSSSKKSSSSKSLSGGGGDTLSISSFGGSPSNPNKSKDSSPPSKGIVKRSSILAADVTAYQLLKAQTKNKGKEGGGPQQAPPSQSQTTSNPPKSSSQKVSLPQNKPHQHPQPDLEDAFSESSDDLSDNAITASSDHHARTPTPASSASAEKTRLGVRIAGQGIRVVGSANRNNQMKTTNSKSNTVMTPSIVGGNKIQSNRSTSASPSHQQSNMKNQQRSSAMMTTTSKNGSKVITRQNSSSSEDEVWSDVHSTAERNRMRKALGLAIVEQHVPPTQPGSKTGPASSSSTTVKVNSSANSQRSGGGPSGGSTRLVTFEGKPQQQNQKQPSSSQTFPQEVMEFEEYEFDDNAPKSSKSSPSKGSSSANLKDNVVSLNVPPRNPMSSAEGSSHPTYIKHTKGHQQSSSSSSSASPSSGKFNALRRRKSRSGSNGTSPGKLLQETIYEEELEHMDGDSNSVSTTTYSASKANKGAEHSVKIQVPSHGLLPASSSSNGGVVKPILKNRERTYETPAINNQAGGGGNSCENNFPDSSSNSPSTAYHNNDSSDQQQIYFDSSMSTISTTSKKKVQFDQQTEVVVCGGDTSSSGQDSYDEENDDSDQWSNKSEDDEVSNRQQYNGNNGPSANNDDKNGGSCHPSSSSSSSSSSLSDKSKNKDDDDDAALKRARTTFEEEVARKAAAFAKSRREQEQAKEEEEAAAAAAAKEVVGEKNKKNQHAAAPDVNNLQTQIEAQLLHHQEQRSQRYSKNHQSPQQTSSSTMNGVSGGSRGGKSSVTTPQQRSSSSNGDSSANTNNKSQSGKPSNNNNRSSVSSKMTAVAVNSSSQGSKPASASNNGNGNSHGVVVQNCNNANNNTNRATVTASSTMTASPAAGSVVSFQKNGSKNGCSNHNNNNNNRTNLNMFDGGEMGTSSSSSSSSSSRILNPNSLLFHDTTRIRLNQSRPALQDSTFRLPSTNGTSSSPPSLMKRGMTRLKQSNSFRSVSSSLTLRPREPPPPPPQSIGKSVSARLQKALSTSTLLSRSTEKLNNGLSLSSKSIYSGGNPPASSHYGPGGKLLPTKAQISLPLGFTTTSKAAGLLASTSSSTGSVDKLNLSGSPKDSRKPASTKHFPSGGVRSRLNKSTTSLATRSKSLTDRCEALEKVLSEQKRHEYNNEPPELHRSNPALNTYLLPPKDDMDSKSIEIVTKENSVSEIRIYSATTSSNSNILQIHPAENLPYQGIIYESTKTIITAAPEPVQSGPKSPEIHYAATDLFPATAASPPPPTPTQKSSRPTQFPHPPLPPTPTLKSSVKDEDGPGKSVVLIIDNSPSATKPGTKAKPPGLTPSNKKKDNDSSGSLPAYSQPIDTIPTTTPPAVPMRASLPPQIPLPSIPSSDLNDDLDEPLYDDVINHSVETKLLNGGTSLGRKSVPPHQLGELPPLPPPPVPPHRAPPLGIPQLSSSPPTSLLGQIVSTTLPCSACPPTLPPPNLPSKSLSEFHNRPLIIQEGDQDDMTSSINHRPYPSISGGDEEDADNLYNDIGSPSTPTPSGQTIKSSTAAFASAMKEAFLGAISHKSSSSSNNNNKQDSFDRRSIHSTGSNGTTSSSSTGGGKPSGGSGELIYDDTLSILSASAQAQKTTAMMNHLNNNQQMVALPLPPPPPHLGNNKEEANDNEADNEPLYDDVLNLTGNNDDKTNKDDKSKLNGDLQGSEYHSSNTSDSGTEDLPPPLPAQGPPPLPKGGIDLPLLSFPLLNGLPVSTTPSSQSQTLAPVNKPKEESGDKVEGDRTRNLLTELNEKLSKLNPNFPPAASKAAASSPGSSSLSSSGPGEAPDNNSGDFSSYHHISKVVISPSSDSSGVEEDYNSEKNYSLSNGSDAASSGGGSDNENSNSLNSGAGPKAASETISSARGKFLENMKLSMLSSMGTSSSGGATSTTTSVHQGLLMMTTSPKNGAAPVLPADDEEEPIYEEIGEKSMMTSSSSSAPTKLLPLEPAEHEEVDLLEEEDENDDNRSSSPVYADAFDAKSMFDGASRSEILSFLESIRDRLTGAESTASSESQSSSISRSSTVTGGSSTTLTRKSATDPSVNSVAEDDETICLEDHLKPDDSSSIPSSPSLLLLRRRLLICPDCNDDIPLDQEEQLSAAGGDPTVTTGLAHPSSISSMDESNPNLGRTASSASSSGVCRSCHRKRNEKKEIIMEVYETELKYGRDLRIISDEFYKPIQVAGLLAKEQLDQIFLNVDQLIQINLELTSRLKSAIQMSALQHSQTGKEGEDNLGEVNVGKIFLELGESMMTTFENYCTRQASAGALLSQLEKEKELLRIFLRVSQMENTVLRRMNLPAFLMVPVQRVTRYPLLLSRLVKVTPPDHFSREELQSAQEKIEQHLEHMNKTTREVASVKLWRRISIINGNSSSSSSNSNSGNGSGPAHRRSNSDLDTSNIRIRKMAMDVLDWTNFGDVTCVMDNQLGSVHINGKMLRNIYGCLLARGKELESLTSKIQEQDPFFPPAEDVVKDVKLVLVRVKNTRFCLLREPLCLSKCVVSQGENEFQDFIEINEITTKNTYFVQGLDKQGTLAWLKFLQCYSSCVGHWRRRRPALANIMMNGMIKHL